MTERHAESAFFVSHASGDDGVVRRLYQALAELDTALAIDSREFHGGDPLDSTIHRAIARSHGVLLLVSPRSHGSAWVGKELKHALKVQAERGGPAAFPVVPLLLDDTPLGVFEALFDEAPIHVSIRSDALDAAPHPILVALRRRLPTDAVPGAQPASEPVEELVLELIDPAVVTHADGQRRARARARLVHVPATPGQREVHSPRFWLEAPLGVIEADDLRWYLEDYAVWPSPLLAERARRIEGLLMHWGGLLHAAALPPLPVAEVLKSWAAADAGRTEPAARRLSIEVNGSPDIGVPASEALALREAAALLLSLPWELLHDGRSFCFQGARPLRVRRRLPTDQAVRMPVLATPIRALLVSPRPEDASCTYIDHRASAGPMVDAMEVLAGQVVLTLLQPPTLPALRDELDRARRDGEPYHVLHFDGHGVYDRHAGLGALCFEHAEDGGRARGERRHTAVTTPDLGALLRDHGIALVFLDACQTAQAEGAHESVASALLKTGVGSVVAMSHSVLVETSRRFVEAFYRALSQGQRVGSAMLAGQRALKDNPVRGRLVGMGGNGAGAAVEDTSTGPGGAGDFTLQDWFVPVLYQDRDDPQLFRQTPSAQTVEDWRTRRANRLGTMPPPPAHGFVGRSRELLALERLLAVHSYAVLLGQGGEGKTALAAEFARWQVRAGQVRRTAFVSVEQHGHAEAVLDALGQQLVSKQYSVAGFPTFGEALEPVRRALREQPTLLVIDNLESVLAPPWVAPAMSTSTGATGLAGGMPSDDALGDDDRERAQAILALAAQLLDCGRTRCVFTSREALPAPFDSESQRVELRRLGRTDAVQLVERALGLDAAGQGRAAGAQREQIEALVDAVQGHARTLALLAPALLAHGPAVVQADLVGLMAAMEQRFPGQREKSVLASVELSLRRLPNDLRQRARALGVFQGAANLVVLRIMNDWEPVDVQALGDALVATGLATPERYNHLSLNPALCPYLRAGLAADERAALTMRWAGAMREFVDFLQQQHHQSAEMSAALTRMDLPNLMALLDLVERAGDAEETIALTTSLQTLMQPLHRPRLLARVSQARDVAANALAAAGWGHAAFLAESARISQWLDAGRVGDALAAAKRLHGRTQSAGDAAYSEAGYDGAMACFLLGRTHKHAGQAGAALQPLDEARRRFEAMHVHTPRRSTAGMVSAAITEQANCLVDLGRGDEAASAYAQATARSQELGDERGVAINQAQLGTLRRMQGRLGEALAAHNAAREGFETLGEPGHVATAWHQIGRVLQDASDGDGAEDAYRRALEIAVRHNDLSGQAQTLGQLGILYNDVLGRPEDAITHYRHSAERFAALQDAAGEGRSRNNMANTLRRLGRLDDARREIARAIACKHGLGHAALPWTSWGILADIEHADGRTVEARQAWVQARDAFLAYRRDGGDSRAPGARLTAEMGQLLSAGDTAAAQALWQEMADYPELPAELRPMLTALHALLTGRRNLTLADTPGLHYSDAAELLLLLDALQHTT